MTDEINSTSSAEQTESIGARIAERLEPGDVVLVTGGMGAGKTTLIRGACRALGVREPITSPTFTIGQLYRGRVQVAHLDLYRLEGLGDEDPGLLADYLRPDSIAFVEWPQKGGEELEEVAPARLLRVEISHAGRDERRITLGPQMSGP